LKNKLCFFFPHTYLSCENHWQRASKIKQTKNMLKNNRFFLERTFPVSIIYLGK